MFRSMVPFKERAPRPLVRLEQEMEDLWERFFGREEGGMSPTLGFAPRVDVAETPTAYEVKVDLPGMKSDEFTVELATGQLCISGKKQEEYEEDGKTFHRVERRYGEFRRLIHLPGEVAEDRIQAEYYDGVLKVTVPKTEAAKPKKIEVKS